MMRPLEIHVLSDGKPGHENQSYGLVEAIRRRREVTDHKIALAGTRGLFGKLREAIRQSEDLPRPDLIVGAGHAVHAALLVLARRAGAPSVVMMKPTLPAALFNLCLVPEHDLEGKEPGRNVIATTGALNRVSPPDGRPRKGGLILLGGPSSAHGWDAAAMESAVARIVAAGGDRAWQVTDSRRSPAGTLEVIARSCPAASVHPHAETGRDWLPQRLAEAAEVWVTEDSISMIYEALSSGAKVGLLPVPAVKKAGRVARGVERLVESGRVTRYAGWSPETGLPAAAQPLREADRCAELVLERLFPGTT